ncbi:protoheme IX farnesyltransferase [Alteribacillus persepolensis]|uniref:Protoheme IX farnesyltransferase n=1 Tax=Alteribacillus persepolensis TaxID=568899 RepID=A0A1G7YCL3_9BACI|nr:heme o synthase [Alteribacillus persepolensis]SDG93670.1 protoheme IX farnesyltransferase [Alteribacillus persepolensis]
MSKTNTAIESSKVIEREETEAVSGGKSWKDYVTLAKMGIVTSNLITTFAGLFLASVYTGFPLLDNLHIAILTLIGAGLVMAGGCTLNNYIDRDIDPLMERTKDRPTVSGTVKPTNVLTAGIIQSAVGVLLLAAVNMTAAVIGVIGLVIYVLVYTMWLKRVSTLNTVVGSFAGAVPPLIGWAAVDPSLHLYAWLLFSIMFIWQPPHFLALAMKRSEEYRAAGVPMLPVVAGFAMTKRQIVVYVAALVPMTLLLYPFGLVYTIAAAILGIGWLALGVAGFKMKDEIKWARIMFVYSINYLTILFVLMVIVHF